MKNLFKVWLLAMAVAFGAKQAFGQFTWTKDARNPVFTGVKGTWSANVFSPCVLYNSDSARYEMWFNATPGPQSDPQWRPYTVGRAVSKDGVNWSMDPSPVLLPEAGKWDAYTIDMPEVIRENGQYKMWYTSWANSTSPQYLGYATSPDGIQWTKYSGNPIFGPGTADWEAGGPWGISITPVRGGYNMWYTGYTADFGVTAIGYATSRDGINWKRDTVHSPILKRGTSGQWDAAGPMAPNVLGIIDSLYMWYVGGNGTSTGLAVSEDGFTAWTKYGANPLLVPSMGTWDEERTNVGSVLLVGDTLHLWYDGWRTPHTSYQYSIGHATSPVKVIWKGIEDGRGNVPGAFLLAQNYPNPFNPRTRIRYQVSGVSDVRITVFDILGREVAVLVNERKAPGSYEVTFDASALASGVYLYRLTAGNFVQTRKMVVVK